MLYLIEKLATAVRGSTREALESAVDANALRIMGQEIYECEQSLRKSKHHLAQVMAEKVRLQRQLESLKGLITDKESVICSHLGKGDEKTALSLAEDMATQETRVEEMQREHDKLQAYEQRLLQDLKTTASKLEHYRTQWRVAQATHHAQQAVGQMTQHSHYRSAAFERLQDSLERIQAQQSGFDDHLQAMQEIDAYLGKGPKVSATASKAAAIVARLKTAAA